MRPQSSMSKWTLKLTSSAEAMPPTATEAVPAGEHESTRHKNSFKLKKDSSHVNSSKSDLYYLRDGKSQIPFVQTLTPKGKTKEESSYFVRVNRQTVYLFAPFCGPFWATQRGFRGLLIWGISTSKSQIKANLPLKMCRLRPWTLAMHLGFSIELPLWTDKPAPAFKALSNRSAHWTGLCISARVMAAARKL